MLFRRADEAEIDLLADFRNIKCALAMRISDRYMAEKRGPYTIEISRPHGEEVPQITIERLKERGYIQV